ncbi:MAG TPA: hypothetical protein VHL79_19885 [Ramlibacter sp.]|nr:hypothetical protein [Ramlibacter sp.]
MRATLLRCLLAAAAATPGLASADALSSSCEPPQAQDGALSDRAGLLALYERLPQACLREIFTACAQASSKSLLDFESAAVCSFSHEALLKNGFNGNFHAMMAWWQSQRAGTQP